MYKKLLVARDLVCKRFPIDVGKEIAIASRIFRLQFYVDVRTCPRKRERILSINLSWSDDTHIDCP